MCGKFWIFFLFLVLVVELSEARAKKERFPPCGRRANDCSHGICVRGSCVTDPKNPEKYESCGQGGYCPDPNGCCTQGGECIAGFCRNV